MDRPWIEHDGTGCPLPIGTPVELKIRSGRIFGGVIGPDAHRAENVIEFGVLVGSAWFWAMNNATPDDPSAVIAYRIGLDPQEEADRVNARQAMFHDWARDAESLTDGDGYLPLKRHERAK
jgi:hypothetical protein